MKNPFSCHGTSSTDPRRRTRRVSGTLAFFTAIALTAACGTAATTDSSATSASAVAAADESSGTVWTTISSAVRQASIGASVSDVLAANADTSEAVAAATSAEQSGSWDTDSATTITLDGDSASVSGDAADSVSVDGTTVTITGSGTFVLAGSLDDGQVVVNAADAEVHLVLDGVTITNADGPAIDIQDAGSAVVVLAEGTENALTDGETYSDTIEDAPTATLFSSDTLTITGTGSLTVTGNSNDGISSKNGLAITGSPTITVTAADDGVRGKDWLLVSGGSLTVTAGGDGLKSTEDDDETKGFVALGEAEIAITSGDDSVSATTDVTVDGTTLSIIAGGGQSNASTVQSQPGWQADPDDTEDESSTDDSVKPKGVNAGVAYSQDSGTVAVDAADEGLQGAFVTVSGGTLTIASGDDGINATNGDYTIEGYENADSESDDGAYLTVTGGQVVVAGSAGSMDGAVDVNGESDVVGVTGSPSVAVGDTITVTSSDGRAGR